MFSDYIIKPTMSLVQKMVYEGAAFRAFHAATIPANGDYTISVQHGARSVHLFFREVRADAPKVDYEVRVGAQIQSYSTPITAFNMNAYSPNPSANTIRVCEASTLGTLVDYEQLGGNENAGNRLVGDVSIEPDDLKVLMHNTEYLIRLVNPNDTPAQAFLYLKWFEQRPLSGQ